MRTSILTIVVILITASMASLPADEITLENLPPVVLGTIPRAGDTNVDPNLGEISVMFDKEMKDKSWSWAQVDPKHFPTLVDQPKFLEDNRTCVVSVKLKPSTTYAIWLNSAQFKNFKGKNGSPAVPYLLAFKTADAKQGETLKKALTSAKEWLKLIDADDYAKSWKETAPFFQKMVPEEKWIEQLSAIRKPFGAMKSRAIITSRKMSSPPNAPKGEYVIFQFRTSFENKSDAIETVTPMLGEDGEWRVSGYYIR